MLQLLLELPADALGRIYVLCAYLLGVYNEVTAAAYPQRTVALALEVGNHCLGDNSLGEWDALLLCVEIVADYLRHAALLQLNDGWLRQYEAGRYYLLSLVHGIAQKVNDCS